MTHLVPVLRPVLGTPFRRGDLYRRAGEVPSFHIAPARTGHARDLITGNLLGTYNSASPAWAVGPDGVLALPAANAPVIEYDPVTLQCLGARIWGAVTNLLLRSEELEATAWGKIDGASVTANQSTGPTGSLTLDRVFGNGSQTGFLFQNFLITLGTAYTFSIFLKKSNSSQVLTLFYGSDFNSGGANPQAIWNLDTGVATFSNNCSGGMILYPNNIYRCYITVTATRTASTSAQFLRMSSLSGDVFAGGAQLQPGSTVGPYVPTTTTAASSTADAWTITGADFNRIINQAEGTIYIEYGPHDVTTPATNNSLFAITTSTTSNANLIDAFVGLGTTPVFRVESNGANQVYITSSAYSPSAIHKLATAYKVDDFARSLDTQSIGTDTSGTLPAVAPSILEIGTKNSGGVKPLNGYIRELAIFRSRRPNANLQAMTQ